jgi:hypothetical protein
VVLRFSWLPTVLYIVRAVCALRNGPLLYYNHPAASSSTGLARTQEE